MAVLENVQSAFTAFETSLNGNSNAELHQKRVDAFEKFMSVGFPALKHEEYKYLNLSWIKEQNYKVAQKKVLENLSIEDFCIPGMRANILAYVDGFYAPEYSNIIDEGSFIIDNIANAPTTLLKEHFGNYDFAEYNPFSSLNLAFARQGGFVHVQKGKHIENPIYLLNINTGTADWVQPHHLIVADSGSSAKIIEAYFSLAEGGIDNTFLRICTGKDANVQHYKVQALAEDATAFGTTHIIQEENSVCSTYVFNLQGKLVRNNIHIELDGSHTEANMYGVYAVNGNEIVDNHTLVDHKYPDCESNELYKGVITDRGNATFNGKIFVQRDAQRTNAFQSNRNLLLSDDATINTKPQLEIWADDVKCSHGATIGRLSEDELFYLRTRGISESKAKAMLTYAFAREVVNLITIPELRDFIDTGIAAKLGFTNI